MVPLTRATWSSPTHKDRKQNASCHGLRTQRRYCLMGTELQFAKMKRVLEMEDGNGRTTMCMPLMPLSYGSIKNSQDGKFFVRCLFITVRKKNTVCIEPPPKSNFQRSQGHSSMALNSTLLAKSLVKFITVKRIIPSTYQMKESTNCLYHRTLII